MKSNRDLNELNRKLWNRFYENLREAVKDLEFEFDPKPITMEDLKVPDEESEMGSKDNK